MVMEQFFVFEIHSLRNSYRFVKKGITPVTDSVLLDIIVTLNMSA